MQNGFFAWASKALFAGETGRKDCTGCHLLVALSYYSHTFNRKAKERSLLTYKPWAKAACHDWRSMKQGLRNCKMGKQMLLKPHLWIKIVGKGDHVFQLSKLSKTPLPDQNQNVCCHRLSKARRICGRPCLARDFIACMNTGLLSIKQIYVEKGCRNCCWYSLWYSLFFP